MLRSILKTALAALTKRAIIKHNTTIIAVVGSHDTGLVKELVYAAVSDERSARRNVQPLWWDLSIPLTVLGYTDKARNFIQWVYLLLKAVVVLVWAGKQEHIIVIGMSTGIQDTFAYWTSYLTPDILILVNDPVFDYELEKMCKATIDKSGQILAENSASVPAKFQTIAKIAANKPQLNESKVIKHFIHQKYLPLLIELGKILEIDRERITYNCLKFDLADYLAQTVNTRFNYHPNND